MHESHNAQQYQCPHCLAEQPHETVREFSKGTISCLSCRKRTRPMIYADYYAQLSATRRRFGVSVHWRPPARPTGGMTTA